MSTASIAARLNRLPPCSTHRRATFVAGIGAFFDLFDIFLAGVLGTVLTQEFALSRLALPAVLSSAFVGMFIGAALFGRLADRAGRRTAFLVNLGVYSSFTLLGAFSVNAPMLVATRFLAGLGIGAELPLVDAYLSELLPSRTRGRYTAWAYTIGFMGVPAAGFLGRVLVPATPFGVSGWRWLFIIGSIGAAIVWTMRASLPESPRWLASVGRIEEAEAITARMEQEARATGPLPAPDPSDHLIAGRASIGAIFRPPYRGRTLMLSVFHVFQAVGYYGFGTLAPLVLASKGYSVATSLTFTSLTFVGYPIGSALSLPIIEQVDRRWLIVGAAVAMGAAGLTLGYSVSPAAILVSGFLYTVASNVFSNALHVFSAEIFPTFARATAGGFTYGLSRLSSAAMPFVLLPVLGQWGAGAMFALVAGALLIVVLDIAFFAPATTGRSLEQLSG